MSILSVDNISPIGSGTSVTVNSAATLVLTNANSTGVITATSFVGSGANLTGVLSNIVEDTSPQLGGTLDTNNQDITFNGAQNISWDSSAADLIFNDYAKINLGTDKDFKMYQAGNNTILQSDNTSGGVYLQGALIQIGSETGEVGVKFVKDVAVELYHNNSKKFETTSYGSLVTGRLNTTGNISMPDNAQIHLGDSIYLALYHDGSDSFIKDTGTGALKVCSNLFRVNNAANDEAMIKAEENAGVTLSYDGNTKFETTSAGITITGAQTTNSGGATNVMNSGATDTVLKFNSTSTNGPHIRFQYDGTDIHYVGSGDGFTPSADREDFAIRFKDRFFFSRDNTNCWYIDGDMHFIPASNNTYDIGRSDTRVRNIYTNDLNLSNEGSSNDVDGTWGDYTIQEGESDLFLINKRSGKKYKFMLQEVS